jgi:hypothetical protein
MFLAPGVRLRSRSSLNVPVKMNTCHLYDALVSVSPALVPLHQQQQRVTVSAAAAAQSSLIYPHVESPLALSLSALHSALFVLAFLLLRIHISSWTSSKMRLFVTQGCWHACMLV